MESELYVTIKSINTDQDNLIMVSEDILPEMWYNGKTKFKFGAKKLDVEVLTGSGSNLIMISKDIMDEFNLEEDIQLCIKFEWDTISLGPLVGISKKRKTIEKLLNQGANIKLNNMAEAARDAKVFAYFFTPKDIIWSNSSVNAVVYRNNNVWERKEMPLPNIIYFRGGGSYYLNPEKSEKLKDNLEKYAKIKRINTKFAFEKWDLYCKLSKHESMNEHLPETVLYTGDIEPLKLMLENHPIVYVKRCGGSNGKGIIRVKKTSTSKYEYDYYKRGIVKEITESLEDIIRVAKKLSRKNNIIFQQGIDAITYQKNKVDMRVLAQRHGNGEWQITSIPVRIAANNCAITSTRSGSKVYAFEDALSNVLKFGSKRINTIKEKILDLIDKTIQALETEYGTFGELGIDVAVDKKGNVWFIEANSKPAKDTLFKAGLQEDIKNAYRHPFEYSKYLSGFNYM